VRREKKPETSGEEGLADVRILLAIEESIRTKRTVSLRPAPTLERKERPGRKQVIERPAVKAPPRVIHADAPHS